jgi:hypothetical protein
MILKDIILTLRGTQCTVEVIMYNGCTDYNTDIFTLENITQGHKKAGKR